MRDLQGLYIWWAATRKDPVGLAGLCKIVGSPFAVSTVNSALAVYAVDRALIASPILSVAICLAVSYVVSLLGSFRPGREELAQSRGMVRRKQGWISFGVHANKLSLAAQCDRLFENAFARRSALPKAVLAFLRTRG